MLRCLDCKWESRFVYAEIETKICIWFTSDEELEVAVDDYWDAGSIKDEDMRCYHCGGQVEHV